MRDWDKEKGFEFLGFEFVCSYAAYALMCLFLQKKLCRVNPGGGVDDPSPPPENRAMLQKGNPKKRHLGKKAPYKKAPSKKAPYKKAPSCNKGTPIFFLYYIL